jgi:hypothetical protein
VSVQTHGGLHCTEVVLLTTLAVNSERDFFDGSSELIVGSPSTALTIACSRQKQDSRMFSCFSSPRLRSRGIFSDRWQEEDHYYRFFDPGKKGMAM